MILSQAESELLYLLESNANLSFKQLGKIAHCKEYTVRRAFHSFVKRGIITGRAVYVDTMRLGLTDHALYFSLAGSHSREENSLLKEFQRSRLVRWLADVGGTFDYSVTFLSPSVGQVREFLDMVSLKYKNVFLGKQLALRTYMVRYPRRYLSKQRSWSEPFAMGSNSEQIIIDSTDQAILFRLSNNSFETDAKVAASVGVSASALARRLANLREKKILVGHTYRVNMSLLGYSSFRVLLVMKRLGADLRENMLKFCQKHIAVRILIESFGSWDYELELELPHTRAIKQFTGALYEAFSQDIYTLQVIPIFQHLKYSGYPHGELV
jgi:DNA-binding Lrp family transcriptional regulator